MRLRACNGLAPFGFALLSLTNAEIGDCAGISSASGTFATYMGKLRSLELVTGRGQVQASPELFD